VIIEACSRKEKKTIKEERGERMSSAFKGGRRVSERGEDGVIEGFWSAKIFETCKTGRD